MKLRTLLMFAALVFPNVGSAETQNKAWIVATPENGMVEVQVFAALEDGQTGSYEMSLIKQGASGRSVNKQAGIVHPYDGSASMPLSTSRVSVEKGATLAVTLIVTSASGQIYESDYAFIGE